MEQTQSQRGNDDTILFHIHRYPNIFSEFDARPFSRRSLSSDFLEELHRQIHAHENPISGFTFVLPPEKRDAESEVIIKERLTAYLRKHISQVRTAKRAAMRHSAAMLLSGAVLMSLTTYIISLESASHFPYTIIRALIEPASWFLLWEGINRYTSRMNELKLDIALREKIAESYANIQFVSEER
ncbi:MAG TPA: hypothetical protein VJ579_02905 [Candidatus Paceibacterota bacterium]|nr:hypothetical protein [Candidatus Paceibacterota bacterium]